MIEHLLNRFAYVRELKAEIERLRFALASADKYARLLEQIKDADQAQIRELVGEAAVKDRMIDERDKEIDTLKLHLSGGGA
jgi:hypothetical protein